MNLNKYLSDPAELPLERIVDDGGFTSIFRTIGCIGDSLSSGEFQSTDEEGVKQGYHDYYEYSWGQYIARAAGCTVYNFSRGGMTAQWYWDTFADERDLWNPDKLCQCYIIALGVNDLMGKNQELGTIEDIDLADWNNNKATFTGYYARIIQRYKSMQPHAKFFLVTMPHGGGAPEREAKIDAHAALLHQLAEMFDYTYVIDLAKYGPVYDGAFRKNFYLGGHMNPQGYILTAKMVMSYIDYIIRHNMEDFAQVPFIGKGVHNYTAKW
ncbi:MAG: SGNH/GDSL hydrolase family protein [Clostridia bacterium]|nr:SGNH/GDSL hydrolase family protein [Clostridia bacterium]